MRRYNWRFLVGGMVLAVGIFAASLALFPGWATEVRSLVALAALALTAAFGFLANFRQAVEGPPDSPPAPPGEDDVSGDKVGGHQNRLDAGAIIGSTVLVGSDNTSTFVQQQTIHQQVVTPELEAHRAEKGRQRYLRAMQQHCQALNITPLGQEANEITLEQVYIALDTTEGIDSKGEKSGKKKAQPELRPDEDQKSLAALDAVSRSSRVVLLGAPGAGKSTFVKMISGWLARAQLEGGAPPPGFSPGLVPVLLTLRDLSKFLRLEGFDSRPPAGQDQALLEGFKSLLKEELARLDALDYLEDLLALCRAGQCLLVLDGLDEVPYDLRARIRRFVSALIQAYPFPRIIVTCRIRSYSGPAEIPAFTRYTLAPFDEQKIQDFINAWYNAFRQHYSAEQIQFRRENLSGSALSPALRELAANPMLLTVMAIIHQEDVHLPPERVKLYKRAVEILLRRWQKQKTGEFTPSARLQAFLNDDHRIYPALERLAYESHRARRADRGDAPELLRKDALDLLERNECLCADGYPLANEFLDYIDQRAGLLVGVGEAPGVPASYSFPHRTFQEYLAGCYLADQRHLFRAVRPLAGEGDTWDLVVVMAFEELYHNRRSVYTLLEASYDLCRPCGVEDEAGQRQTLWAGQIAALIGKKAYEQDEDKAEQSRAFLSQITPGLLGVMAGRLPPVERAEAGNTLAQVGDPRRAVMTVAGMQFCLAPRGPFKMGEAKELHEVNLPYDFWIGRYPVTNAQFAEFVQAKGYQAGRFWPEAEKRGYWSAEGFKGAWDNEPRDRPSHSGGVFDLPNHPAVGISWYEALAFARWLGERLPTGWQADLPSEAEWEKTARGGLELPAQAVFRALEEQAWDSSVETIPNGSPQRTYPWDAGFDARLANTAESGIGATSAVGCFPGGAGPYGAEELSGSVWEWTRSAYVKYPYDAGDGREVLDGGDYRVLRGGSWLSDEGVARCSARYGDLPSGFDRVSGFRVVVRPSSR